MKCIRHNCAERALVKPVLCLYWNHREAVHEQLIDVPMCATHAVTDPAMFISDDRAWVALCEALKKQGLEPPTRELTLVKLVAMSRPQSQVN